ncbi:uncharacterized protein LOC125675642 isoform X2 [Ostrea edulis]|uniref:uncharacterized protein LOC125675642 isoform X2 n=1 Tax=Ostrea edulis TaxID=37623 RepID=UPI0024AEACA6|nr:uncharacterized protein LOC125675642 isoform X2 [Ostrea edulis]
MPYVGDDLLLRRKMKSMKSARINDLINYALFISLTVDLWHNQTVNDIIKTCGEKLMNVSDASLDFYTDNLQTDCHCSLKASRNGHIQFQVLSHPNKENCFSQINIRTASILGGSLIFINCNLISEKINVQGDSDVISIWLSHSRNRTPVKNGFFYCLNISSIDHESKLNLRCDEKSSAKKEMNAPSSSQDTPFLLIGILCGTFLLVSVAIVIVIVVLRRRRAKRTTIHATQGTVQSNDAQKTNNPEATEDEKGEETGLKENPLYQSADNSHYTYIDCNDITKGDDLLLRRKMNPIKSAAIYNLINYVLFISLSATIWHKQTVNGQICGPSTNIIKTCGQKLINVSAASLDFYTDNLQTDCHCSLKASRNGHIQFQLLSVPNQENCFSQINIRTASILGGSHISINCKLTSEKISVQGDSDVISIWLSHSRNSTPVKNGFFYCLNISSIDHESKLNLRCDEKSSAQKEINAPSSSQGKDVHRKTWIGQ